jgi:hypothetical protein
MSSMQTRPADNWKITTKNTAVIVVDMQNIWVHPSQMLKLGLVKPNSYARPYAMPPGVPPDRVRAVEAAFLKSLNDPEFVAEAEKTRMTVSPIAGTDLHKMIVEGLSMPPALKTKLKPILAPKN